MKRKRPEEDAALSDRLHNGARAIHMGEGVQHLLRSVGDFPFGLLEIPEADGLMRRSDNDREADHVVLSSPSARNY